MTLSLSRFLQSVGDRSAAATINQSRFGSDALRRHLRRMLIQPLGTPGSFLSDPVIEAGFDWQRHNHRMGELAGNLLHPDVIGALDQSEPVDPNIRPSRSRFARDWFPFRHQVDAWTMLRKQPAHSVLVSSGTGSGKTECFLVPILDAMAHERALRSRLTGVRAIMLYPLNALINSQRDRLTDWIEPFGGDIRFCLYNGKTKEELRKGEEDRHPWEVLSRKSLRNDPPPLLVTNVTMLEYMLVRAIDTPIIDKSRGMLRWIVLDEVHTYIGSQAAELSLLIRRVLRAFGVSPEDVRFVATSATIGEGAEVRQRLKKFMADVAGVAPDRVQVIEGRRNVPRLEVEGDLGLPEAGDLVLADPEKGPARLAASAAFRSLYRSIEERPMTLSVAAHCLFGKEDGDRPYRRDATLDLIDAASRMFLNGQRLLPLRLHLFHRSQPGLWACMNQGCPGRADTELDVADWPFGSVFAKDRLTCPHCEASVIELHACVECSSPVLPAEETDDGFLRARAAAEEADEFAQDIEPPPEDEQDEDQAVASQSPTLVLPLGTEVATEIVCVERKTGRVLDAPEGAYVRVGLFRGTGCPHCRARPNARRPQVFVPARFSAPFLLGSVIPQLLDEAPPKGTGLPFEGRQLITFTDSRQGTARFAAKLQQDADRNYTRSVLYQMVQEPLRDAGETETKRVELQQQLWTLEALLPKHPEVQKTVDRIRAELAELDQPPNCRVSWMNAVTRLGERPETARWMRDLWQSRDSEFSSVRRLAEVQLLREFIRRPKRQNSAETMGLVTLVWPAIEALHNSALPRPFNERGLSIKDWRSFLNVLVTHFIRANNVVAIDRDTLRWIGRPGSPKEFLPPGEPNDRKTGTLAWPVAGGIGRLSRPVRLLERILQVDAADPGGRDHINECLKAAWTQLQRLRRSNLPHFQLDLEKASLAPLRRGWICPITGRILDHVVCGATPYMPLGQYSRSLMAQTIELPLFPFSWGRRDGQLVTENEVLDWLTHDPKVTEARERGVWSDLHDRIALQVPYIRVAEHSAQQSSTRLQVYEDKFKRGELNILSCSTTMEMGVDIGGISTVVMTNVPPAPANYRQRVGRAGRRDEARAVGLTFCKDTPLGWTVFQNPLWPFEQAVRPPSVSLDSPIIVQRHVNAFLLSTFLKVETADTDEDALHLRAGWFFGSKADETGGSVCSRYIYWCDTILGVPEEVEEAVRTLVRYTCLESRQDLAMVSAEDMHSLAINWRNEWQGLDDTRQALRSSDKTARQAIDLQIKRLEREYLLRELATRGFLPGYGFPTDVVSFVTGGSRQTPADKEREDNRFTPHDYPSRSLDIAIRDYAPGSEVVLDGLVYKCSGVTLNWQRPSSQEQAREIQSLRHAWKCKECGTTDTSGNSPDICSSCGSDNLQVMAYLRPAGFTVDIRNKPHTDITRPRYVAPAEPWISARRAPWVSLNDPSVGRFRASREGHVFHYSGGNARHGFAVCLHCGRAAEDTANASRASLPAELQSHRPLRGAPRHGRPDKELCPGNDKPFAIQRGLHLGHDLTTDVFELQLLDLDRRDVATSLAVALREALARQLGIEIDEMGWKALRTYGPDGRSSYSVLLYDRAAGGAGFSVQAAVDLVSTFRGAAEVINCANQCERACHACLLTSDTQFDAALLDRKAAGTFLKDQILGRLVLPEALQFFGPLSVAEHRQVIDALDQALRDQHDAALTIWTAGHAAEFDLAQWSLRPLLEKWGARGREVCCVLPATALDQMTLEQRLTLVRMVERWRARLALAYRLPRFRNGHCIAVVQGARRCHAWGTGNLTVAAANEEWGTAAADPIIRGELEEPVERPVPVDLATLTKDLSHLIKPLQLFTELDGPIVDFGQAFWNAVGHWRLIRAGQQITKIEYNDRYLRSPLSVRLLVEILRPVAAAAIQRAECRIHTTAPDSRDGREPFKIHHDWKDRASRDTVLSDLIAQLNLLPKVIVRSRKELPHDRALVVTWQDGQSMRIGLDQGLGYWSAHSSPTFPFTARAHEQAHRLRTEPFDVQTTASFSTVLYLHPLQSG